MYAAYRLIGNFPSRGFGDSLSSAEFTSGAAIVTGTDARLPMNGVPHTREPQKVGEVAESYHAYEIHPLTFGQLTVLYSATGKMMQATGATRPCSYTNFVTWSGDEVPAFVSDDAPMCSMLRYNDFVTLQEFWTLPKEITALPTKPWVTDDSISLEYTAPVPVTDAMLRSLLAHYWRSATLSFFGPWDSGKKAVCLYQHDLLMQHITKRDRNVSVCISASDDCQEIVPQAKGFLWQLILKKLPAQVRNITSMAAAVPLQQTQSMYRDAALCVVYPHPDVKFNLVNGIFPALDEDEDQFIKQVLDGKMGRFMESLHQHYAKITGKKSLDECPFMADYDLALALYRLEHAQDDWALLTNWYAAQCHLNMRHDIHGRMASRLMQDVDAFANSRLKGREQEIVQMLLSQADRNRALMSRPLQSFLWEKAVYNEDNSTSPAQIVTMCPGNGAQCFFTDYASAQTVPQDDRATQNMAALMSNVLQAYHTETQLTDTQIQQLLKVAPVYHQSEVFCKTLADYLAAYQKNFPQDRIRLLQLSTQYLDTDKEINQAFEMLMATRLDAPLTEEECKAILHVLPLIQDAAGAYNTLTAYLTALYCRHYPNVAVVAKTAVQLRVDTTAALIQLFTQAPGWDFKLDDKTQPLVLGPANNNEYLLANARNVAEVEKAFRVYLKHQLDISIGTDKNQYNWCVNIINHALPTRFYTEAKTKESFLNWCAALVMDYTLDFAKASVTLPSDSAFSRMLNLAAQKSPVFSERLPKLMKVYEHLLFSNVDGAARQAQQLAPYLYGIPEDSLLQTATSNYISVLLQTEWAKGNFWQVLNRKDIVAHINRNGALPQKIFDEETKAAAAQAIRREVLSTIQQPREYDSLFSSYGSQEITFKRAITLPGMQTDNTVSILWHDVTSKCLMEQFDAFFQACKNIDQTHTLREVADRNTVPAVQQRIRDSYNGKVIRQLRETQSFISNLPEEKLLISRTMERSNMLRTMRSEKAVSLVETECDAQIKAKSSFIQKISISLLHCTKLNGLDWSDYLHTLQPDMDGMLHNPYASGSLPLLSAICASLRVFEIYPTQDNLLQSFLSYLKTDSVMASYTNAVKKDQKTMALFFPGLANYPSLSSWLIK